MFSNIEKGKGKAKSDNATKAAEKASEADFSKPKHYLDDALKQQGLDKGPEKLKQKWTHGDYNYEVRVHPGDPKYTDAKTIYIVSRKAKPVPGMEYMDKNGKWWHQSELREFNGNVTHIPTD